MSQQALGESRQDEEKDALRIFVEKETSFRFGYSRALTTELAR